MSCRSYYGRINFNNHDYCKKTFTTNFSRHIVEFHVEGDNDEKCLVEESSIADADEGFVSDYDSETGEFLLFTKNVTLRSVV